jgi:hypothetical protein
MPVSEVRDPVTGKPAIDFDGYYDALNDANEQLERIRKETPRFPRWFVLSERAFIWVPEFGGIVDVDLLRHTSADSLVQAFAGGVWRDALDYAGKEPATLNETIRRSREIGRAEAYAITGGNP